MTCKLFSCSRRCWEMGLPLVSMCVVAQAQLDALQTEQPPLSSDGHPEVSADAPLDHGSFSTDANHSQKPQLEEPEQRLQHEHAEIASLQAMCGALSSDLQGARERVESLQLECEHSQSQHEEFGAAVAGHLGLRGITAGEAVTALAAHQAAHEATRSGLLEAAAAAQQEVASARTAHADSLAAAECRLLDLQKERDSLTERLQSLETRNTTLSTELTDHAERHAGLIDKHNHLQAELATLQESSGQHSALQSQHATLSAQIGSLQEERAKAAQQHKALQEEHSALQQSSHSVEAQKALHTIQTEHNTLREDFAANEKALAELTKAAAGSEQLSQQLQQLQVALDTAEKERASAIQQLEALQVRLSDSCRMPSKLAC